jgi:hypothetical protein
MKPRAARGDAALMHRLLLPRCACACWHRDALRGCGALGKRNGSHQDATEGCERRILKRFLLRPSGDSRRHWRAQDTQRLSSQFIRASLVALSILQLMSCGNKRIEDVGFMASRLVDN